MADRLVSFFGKVDERMSTMKTVMVAVVVSALVFAGAVFSLFTVKVSESRDVVYVLDGDGHASIACSVDRSDLTEIEVRDHVLMFHELVLNVVPDLDVIRENHRRAGKLCDDTGVEYWQALNDRQFYDRTVRASAVQMFRLDSMKMDISRSPYRVAVYGTLKYQSGRNTNFYSFVSRCSVTRNGGGTVDAENPHGMIIRGFVGQQELMENRKNW